MANEIEVRVNAQDRASRALRGVSSAAEDMQAKVRRANLGVEASQLRVEKATTKLTEVQGKYGRGSIQEREALNSLSRAQLGLESSSRRLTSAEHAAAAAARKVGSDLRRTNTITETTQRRFDALGSRMRSFGTIAVSALAGVAVAAGVAATAGAALGIKTASFLEQAQISYETLLGSADKAKSHIKDLIEFAKVTPFELNGLVEADRALVGAGESADKTIKSLTAWGNVSGALGQTQEQFSRTLLAVTQMMGKGKVQAEELMQITEAGIPIWTIMSKAMHKPIPELQDMATKGKLLAKDVLPALERQMGKDYGGAMARQSQTLAGLWSTLKDTLSQGLAQAIQPLIPVLKGALPGAIDFLTAALGKGAGALSKFIDWIKNNKDFHKFADSLKNTMGVLADNLGNIGAQVAPTLKDLAKDILPHLTHMLDRMSDAMKAAHDIKLDTALAAVVKVLGGGFIMAVIGAIDTVAAFAEGIHKLFSFLKRIPQSLSSAKDAVGDFISAIGDRFTELPGRVGDALKGLPGAIVSVLDTAKERTLYAVGFLIGWTIRKFAELPAKTLHALWGLIKAVNTVWNAAGRAATAAAKWLVSHAISEIRKAPGQAASALKALPGKIKGAVAGAGKWLYEAGKNVVRGMVGGIRDYVGQIRGSVSSMIHGLVAGAGFAHGGITGAATGGVHGSWRTVGEHGRELVKLPAGSQVVSNPDTERMLSEGGNGGGGGQLEVVLRVEGADKEMVNFIRRIVRVSGGGNVQAAFGN